MNDVLNQIIEHKKVILKNLKGFEYKAKNTSEKFRLESTLKNNAEHLKIIAEFKKASPSNGDINLNADICSYMSIYDKYADAISVLCEDKFFKGSLMDLKTARSLTLRPLLAKDFYIDPVQVDVAAENGADSILIIVKILSKDQIKSVFERAEYLGLDSIFEIHSRSELDLILENFKPRIIGVNVRNLKTFGFDYKVADELQAHIPSTSFSIFESGLNRPDSVKEVKGKYDGVLIGTALMRAESPERFFEELKRWSR
jgi:indole-3-glycerol phosphate synthase